MIELVMQGWDDIDLARDGTRTRADTSVRFSFRGLDYELDLTEEHAAEMDGQLAPWIAAARHLDSAKADGSLLRSKGSGLKVRSWEHGRAYGRAIRQFAREQGTPLGAYISRDIRDRFAAHLLEKGVITEEQARLP